MRKHIVIVGYLLFTLTHHQIGSVWGSKVPGYVHAHRTSDPLSWKWEEMVQFGKIL